MSFSIVSQPSTNSGAYDFAALKYEFKDSFAYTGTANDGGNLQLTGISSTTGLAVNEFVWVESLVNYPNVATPVVQITAVTATTITVSIVFLGAYPISGEIRALKTANFIIRTGQSNTSQPFITHELELRANPNGIYTLNPFESVISRFLFREPVIGSSGDYDHSVEYVGYELNTGAGSAKYAFKSNTDTPPRAVIRYSGLNNIITYLESGGTQLKTALESSISNSVESAGSVETDIEVYAFDCVGYLYSFTAPFDEGFTTYTPEDWVTVTVADQLVQSVTFNFEGQQAGEYSWTLSFNDGGGTSKVFNFTIQVQTALVCRPSCGGRRFVWWSVDGAWCSYEFNRTTNDEFIGGQAQLREVSNVRSVVRYDDQQNLLNLIADYEGEEVFDYLRGMLFALNVYEVIELTDSTQTFDLFYLPDANGVPKNTQPFIATSNRFAVELVKGEIQERINESR